MSTLVFMHAHPDDESSQTAGTMALAHDAGHRVVWICCTNGDHGAVPDDLDETDDLVSLRRREAEASARVLGVDRLVWLGYADSGMHGWDQNSHEFAFVMADVTEAGRRVADVLDDEDADVLIGYDFHGNYGHPDHVQVHRVMNAAVEQAARRPRVLQVTGNRDAMRRGFAAAVEAGLMPPDDAWDIDSPLPDGNLFGTPEDEIQWAVDVRGVIDQKRAALACHASQPDAAGMLLMPEEMFREGFGWEHYIEQGLDQPMIVGWPFDDQTPVQRSA
ncbi:PIG-L family deacetylase [Aestuariimicrobium ganziense]|uniref:PIG-L family deacetylase n=1 Tax=Aestuariimicrobium ganziense TaxID=2773677 RepID=UPI001F4310A6|nr:PIG-L family deacetylase [Aestuariimicrobium ganziense]